MSKYGVDACTECGTVSELLLAPRFPHICARCLFPPTPPEDPTADLIGAPPQWTPADTLAERLQAHKSNGRWRGDLESFGRKLPETYNRGAKE